MAIFGPSGNSQSFYDQGHESSLQMPEWLNNMGLDAYEYSCSKGVKIGKKSARELGNQAKENNIFLSIHAPYYINMASEELVKRENSIRYVIKTLEAASWMDAKRVVVHVGSYAKVEREWAMETAIDVMKKTIKEADNLGYGDINICPEVLGKKNQLGSLEEILEICLIDERLIPTIDFGHLYARSGGALNSIDDFEKILSIVENVLGKDRLNNLHIHFSRVEFTKGGEKRHRGLSETEYGPEFEFLAHAIYKKQIKPVIICESRENMAEDALELKKTYKDVVKFNER